MEFTRPALVLQGLLLVLVVCCAFTDLRGRRVLNWVTLPALALAIGMNAVLYGAAGLRISLEGAGLALLVYFPLYLIRAMGAGDVKLMAAIGAAAGPSDWVLIFALTSLVGGVAAILLVLWTGRLRLTMQNLGLIAVSLIHLQAPYRADPQNLDVKSERAARLPHAIVIAAGTIGFLVIAGFRLSG